MSGIFKSKKAEDVRKANCVATQICLSGQQGSGKDSDHGCRQGGAEELYQADLGEKEKEIAFETLEMSRRWNSGISC